jgi:pentapeptide repeat protein
MTLRDWLQLLVIPFALVVISFLFTMQQDARQVKIEDQRAKSERELAEQRAQDEALQAYLDQMGQLLLEKNLPDSKEGSEVRTLARARTLTVLRRLDATGKGDVIQFLSESGLISAEDGPVVSLVETDLSRANLSNADLSGAYLYAADLSDTNLFGADLSGAELRQAILSGADLREANLTDARLLGADLSEANLSGVFGVTRVQLKQQADSVEGAIMPGAPVLPRQGRIAAGRYTSDEFEPALSFEISTGWEVHTPETAEQIVIQTVSEEGQLIFTSPHQVFVPEDPGERKNVPAPENVTDWISWFQNHPNLNISKPVSINVGGATGVRTDVTPTSTTTDCDGHPCVRLFPTTDQEGTDILIYGAGKGKDRFIIVDLGGETVVIDIYAEEEDFDEFLLKAMNVLNTIEWKGA